MNWALEPHLIVKYITARTVVYHWQGKVTIERTTVIETKVDQTSQDLCRSIVGSIYRMPQSCLQNS